MHIHGVAQLSGSRGNVARILWRAVLIHTAL